MVDICLSYAPSSTALATNILLFISVGLEGSSLKIELKFAALESLEPCCLVNAW